MEKDKKKWNQFQRIKLDRKSLARRMKRAETSTVHHANRFVVKRLQNVKMVRREITQWLAIVGILIAAIGVQLLWGQREFFTAAHVGGGSYVEGVLGPIETLNPLYAATSAEASVGKLIFSSLYDYDQTGSLHSDVAASMVINDASQVYTVTLKDGVKWHDGAPLTAKDVVFTINLMKNPATRSPLRINWLDVSARAVDEKTVQFTLPVPYAAFPHALTFPIMPHHLLSSVSPGNLRESPFSSSPVGSGPFKYKLLQSTDAVRELKAVHLEANEHYFDGRPKLDRMELQAYRTEADIVKALQIGAVNGATDISITNVNKLSENTYSIIPQPLHSGTFLLLNNTHQLLADIKIRKALMLATDTDALRRELGEGLLPLDSPFLRGQLTGDDVPRAPAYNAAQAGALLDEAGWRRDGEVRKKDGVVLKFKITTTKDSEYEKVLDIVSKQWQTLGITVEKQIIDTTNPASSFVQGVLQPRNYDILLYELSIGADPDIYAYWHSTQIGQTGYNFANYSSKLADASLASARTRLEPDLRNAKYKQFARQWIDDVASIGLYQPVVEYVVNKNVSAVKPGSRLVTGADRYTDVVEWSINRAPVYKTP